jgi:hypothetical protein
MTKSAKIWGPYNMAAGNLLCLDKQLVVNFAELVSVFEAVSK